MNCFYHQEVTAIGTCKVCTKGLCPDCAVDLGHSLACKNRHEDQASKIQTLISGNIKATSNKGHLIGPAFYILMGLLFAGFGLFAKTSISWFPAAMGAGFALFGIVIFFYTRAVWSNRNK